MTQAHDTSKRTIGHYEGRAELFWEGTKDHDVSQNIQALIDALPGVGPHHILDLGCQGVCGFGI